ncbi:MAG: GvpL/GvpF family gas vesicle protein [Hyphomicrobium sp.]|uniref:GvpL/GvpF family gas vesicle protein n=1 Tax=Hyphomicrobium sp. TaxID=82 RepID=UPI001323590A|nr:GvpL/GvpF family gas vesicle protein [Hyphomicrobium sp.]KAB2939864.1 MAG: GvpL/GvpF family gas vesicle protein [Hyphomicrobium sp.]MBZ0208651.1 GvpL/GvpF family gas vesicle protein [Hyphomicrobium sp.]
MSARGPALEDAGKSLVYIYGVARVPPDREPTALPGEGIIGNAPVCSLVQGDLVAFGSTVPASLFGAPELRAALADKEWLRDRVLAHEKILEQLRSGYTLVPFRFCSIYRDTAQVADALARHRAELDAALDRVSGASEWGVKLYCDPEVLRCRLEAASGAMRRLREAVTTASPGTQFFLQKKFDRALDAEVAAAIARCAEQSRRRLDACARESAAIPVQPRAAHGKSVDMILNAAYLVDEKALDEFRFALAPLQDEAAANGFSYELTGPWPPYHFVTAGQEGIQDAARSDR